MRRLLALTCAAAGLAAIAPATAGAVRTQDLQVLAINDLHGNLEPPSGSSGRIQVGPGSTNTVNAGGAAYLATHLDRLAEGHRHSIFASAGDNIGGTPLVSALFHDEPTIEALNMMDLEVSAVGNHEFDEGYRELQRMQRGGCHPVDGCQDGDPYFGADFPYLAANVRFQGTDRTILPRYWTRGIGHGTKVGFIGLTLQGTPTVVTPAGIAGLQFDEEVATINRYAHRLSLKGVKTIIVLLHQGGFQAAPFSGGYADINGCENLSGDVVPMIDRINDQVDAVVTAHTHSAYNCRIDGKLVTQAASFGRVITELDFKINQRSRNVISSSATNHIVTRDVAPDPEIQALIDEYKTLSRPIAQQVYGTASADIVRAANAAGESPLGNLIADSQLAATSSPETGGAQIAFMNPGGIRADLLAGEITYEELFTVQPFANTLTVKTFTGDQIRRLLEQQFDNPAAGENRILQVSEGFSYTWSASAPAGSRVSNITLNGVPLDPNGTYRVTMNSFLATGGDNFSVFNEGTDVLGGPVDLDAFSAFIEAAGTIAPPPVGRIIQTP